MEIEDSKYQKLLTYIETGARGNLPQEMVEYVGVLELIRSMHMRYENRQSITRFLQQPPYNLSYYQATCRYSEAINFFYLDNEIKKKAWRNLYAEKLDRAAELVWRTATCSKDMDICKNILYAAMEARGLKEPDEIELPKAFFEKPFKIFILDPALIGRKPANRKLLAKHIDELDVPEYDKQRARSDAMIDNPQFINDEEEPAAERPV